MDFNIETLESAFTDERYALVDELAAKGLAGAGTVEEQIRIFEIQVDAWIARNRYAEALQVSTHALDLLNIKLPHQPTPADVRTACRETQSLMDQRDIGALAQLPAMRDPLQLATLRLLGRVETAAYFGKPLLYPLIICRVMAMLIQSGNSPDAPYWFALYGMVLCGWGDDIGRGVRFGRLALEMADHHPAYKSCAKILKIVQGYILHWEMPLGAGLEPLESAYRQGLKAGDSKHAAHCALFNSSHAFACGIELERVEARMADNSRIIAHRKCESPFQLHELFRQVVANLRQPSRTPFRLLGPYYNEEWKLDYHRKSGDQVALGSTYLAKLHLCYLFGEFEAALDNALLAREYRDALTASFRYPLYCQYEALARLALCATLPHDERRQHLKIAKNHITRLKHWATHGPANYRHKYFLVEGEYQRVRGHDQLAAQRYDQAIELACSRGFIQEAALACELAGRYYKSLGRPRAAFGYLYDALQKYRQWGADAKVRHLIRENPELAEVPAAHDSGESGSPEYRQIFEDSSKEPSRHMETAGKLDHLAAAIEQAVEGIAILDHQGTVTYVNPALENILDLPKNLLEGRHITAILEGSGNDGLLEEVQQQVLKRRVWSGPVRYQRSGSVDVQMEITVSPVQDPLGSLSGFVVLGRDVSYELQMEKELRQAQKMEAIGTLAGGIAHDFNNILLAILGYTELAALQVQDDPETSSHLENVLAASHRAKDLVRQILAFSRQAEQEMQPVELHFLIKETLRLLRATLPTTIEIRQELDYQSDVVLADPTKIHQLIMNLCTNAAHAMQAGGGVLTLALKACPDQARPDTSLPELVPGRYVALEVRDTGSGIPEKIRERIFEPFFTTKDPGRGTGMGLAVSHGIVKGHRGAITVESEPEKGSTFRIYLPIHEDTPAEDDFLAEGGNVFQEELKTPKGHEHILLVDDEPALTELGEDMLQDLGYRVTAANDSTQALRMLIEQPDRFDMLVTDQTMPRKTGLQLAREVLAEQPDLPIILTTGYSESVSNEKVDRMGIRALIMKPYSQQKLAKTIRSIFD